MWTVTIGKVLGTNGLRPCLWFKIHDTCFSIELPAREEDETIENCIQVLTQLKGEEKSRLKTAYILCNLITFEHDKKPRYFRYDERTQSYHEQPFIRHVSIEEQTCMDTIERIYLHAKAQWPKGTKVYGRNVDGIFKGEITEIGKDPGIAVIYAVLKCDDGQLRDAHVDTLTEVGDGKRIELRWPEVVKLLKATKSVYSSTNRYVVKRDTKDNTDCVLLYDESGHPEDSVKDTFEFQYYFEGETLTISAKKIGYFKQYTLRFDIPASEVLEIINGEWK